MQRDRVHTWSIATQLIHLLAHNDHRSYFLILKIPVPVVSVSEGYMNPTTTVTIAIVRGACKKVSQGLHQSPALVSHIRWLILTTVGEL